MLIGIDADRREIGPDFVNTAGSCRKVASIIKKQLSNAGCISGKLGTICAVWLTRTP